MKELLQQAVEARDDSSTVRQINAPDAGPIPEICEGMDKAAVWSYAHLCGYRSALQQQEVPSEPDQELVESLYRIAMFGDRGNHAGMAGQIRKALRGASPSTPAHQNSCSKSSSTSFDTSPSTTEKPVSSEMLRQCAASGQMDSAQIHAHEVAGEMGVGAESVKAPCLTCAANHYCPTHNPTPGVSGPDEAQRKLAQHFATNPAYSVEGALKAADVSGVAMPAPAPSPDLLEYHEVAAIVAEVMAKYPNRDTAEVAQYAADRTQRAVLKRNAGVALPRDGQS